MTPQIDVMEVACSPNSTLTKTFESQGYVGKRISSGYSFGSKKSIDKLALEIPEVSLGFHEVHPALSVAELDTAHSRGDGRVSSKESSRSTSM